MNVLEREVEAIVSSLPQQGDIVSYRTKSNQDPTPAEYEEGRLRVDTSRPLGQTACKIEGLTITPEDEAGESYVAHLTYNAALNCLSVGEVTIYLSTNESTS